MVRGEAVRAKLVAMLRSPLAGDGDAVADLDGFRSIDAHHRKGDVRVQAFEHGLAEPGRYAARTHGYPRARGVPVPAQLAQVVLEERELFRIRAEKRIAARGRLVEAGELEGTEPRQPARD